MAEVFNFFVNSDTFCKTVKNIKGRKVDYIEIIDAILRHANCEYRLSNGLAAAELTRKLNKQGFDVSKTNVERFLRLIRHTKDWLDGSDKQKKAIEKEIKKLKDENNVKFLLRGINSFREDGILTWSQVIEAPNYSASNVELPLAELDFNETVNSLSSQVAQALKVLKKLHSEKVAELAEALDDAQKVQYYRRLIKAKDEKLLEQEDVIKKLEKRITELEKQVK